MVQAHRLIIVALISSPHNAGGCFIYIGNTPAREAMLVTCCGAYWKTVRE